MMYSSWQEYINEFKGMTFTDRSQLLRISLAEEELDHFWNECALGAMEQFFMLSHPTIINFLYSNLLPSYLSSRKLTQEAYSVSADDEKGQEQCLMYVYDCRLFRGSLFTK